MTIPTSGRRGQGSHRRITREAAAAGEGQGRAEGTTASRLRAWFDAFHSSGPDQIALSAAVRGTISVGGPLVGLQIDGSSGRGALRGNRRIERLNRRCGRALSSKTHGDGSVRADNAVFALCRKAIAPRLAGRHHHDRGGRGSGRDGPGPGTDRNVPRTDRGPGFSGGSGSAGASTRGGDAGGLLRGRRENTGRYLAMVTYLRRLTRHITAFAAVSEYAGERRRIPGNMAPLIDGALAALAQYVAVLEDNNPCRQRFGPKNASPFETLNLRVPPASAGGGDRPLPRRRAQRC